MHEQVQLFALEVCKTTATQLTRHGPLYPKVNKGVIVLTRAGSVFPLVDT